MVITEVEREDVVAECRKVLGLSATSNTPVDDAFLAAMLRRSAGTLCPCSPTTLRSSLLDSLQHLDGDDASLAERIDAVIEGLIVGGDLLELSEVTTEDTAVKGTWVFAAPPSFVVRPNGRIFLTGIVRDQDTFLPQALASRIAYEGFTRVIAPAVGEDLRGELREQGLGGLSEAVWLKNPKVEPAEDLLNAMDRRLASQPRCGEIGDLQIIDPGQRVTYYPGRWTTPTDQNGAFVARRPQDYGAPIWCFVALENGVPVRLLDLPLRQTRWRGCDAAWHLQMAIDHCRKHPQLYRRRCADDGVRLDFFSPLPQWSQRRLMIFGGPVPRENSLMSFRLPIAEADTEERFLQKRLWLVRTDNSD